MELGLVAAVMAMARACDDRRFEGCAMLGALPGAPVVDEATGARWWRRPTR
jgi:hypothetical protein